LGLVHFHDRFIRPEVLRRSRPQILEIGIASGSHTRRLLGACLLRLGKIVCIDPFPGPAIERMLERHPLATLHKDTSLRALPKLVESGLRVDVGIVDGDHNYYTVCQELEQIERMLTPTGVIILHDTGWPFGRRDRYFDPDSIPEALRQPYARGGIVRGQSALSETEGINRKRFNATHEGGPKNGVLTAAEDFVATNPARWVLEVHDEEFGLGIIRQRTA